MKRAENIDGAVYRKIAIDIAENIVDGTYTEGQKLFGRSVLSSRYNVSPETIRKAVYLLKDVGILDTEKGSGIKIISSKNAKEFISRNEETRNISEVKHEIIDWAKRQEKETIEIVEKIEFVASVAEKLKVFNPFVPFEIKITSSSDVVNKTVQETKIWQNTGTTVIAIKRGDDIILSPGPYATFTPGDTVYLVGTEQSFLIAKNFIDSKKNNKD